MLHLVIIGGGAAGFFCAANLHGLEKELKITILEKTSKTLGKVKISGGGRCNVTNADFNLNRLDEYYPRGGKKLKKLFSIFGQKETISWFEKRGAPLKVEDDQRMFPQSNDSQTIIDCLRRELPSQVHIRMKEEVIAFQPNKDGCRLQLASGEVLQADYVVIAAGGKNKNEHLNVFTENNLEVVAPAPSLFSFNVHDNDLRQLKGLAVSDAEVRIEGTKLKYAGPAIITHWGLSGPAVLKASAFAARVIQEKEYEYEVGVNWLNQSEEEIVDFLRVMKDVHPKKMISNIKPEAIPQRLWRYLLERAELREDKIVGELSKKEMNRLRENLFHCVLKAKGKTTYKDEFVTAGGLSIDELQLKTMRSHKYPSVYFAGEVVDIDGITGGYNFTFAWASGFVAASDIRKRVLEITANQT
ncbi:MAG: aminoacetone oxidase family FAD-binding enzyme [Cyclobacteriaceae bacterium]|nr:aminoacetone oxidase family FAD-binding enzyme [Cyclobacteriaceae bacterium]MCH8516029.1 aminoacetone oxidase family FAD-binding enzyme [Cyclobacteriaceae bacterium]